MITSQRGVDLIKSFEGLSLRAVRLKGEQYYTIGYGHYGPDVQPGQTMTVAEAEALLRKDLKQFEKWVNSYCTAKARFTPNQNQFDALVSFCYNCGPGSLDTLVSGRTAQEVAAHIMAYTKSSSPIYEQGLRNRRLQERALFLKPAEEDELDMTKEELMSVDGTGDNPTSWAVPYTDWAKDNGIFNGDGQGNYGWQQPISREGLAIILKQLSGVITKEVMKAFATALNEALTSVANRNE